MDRQDRLEVWLAVCAVVLLIITSFMIGAALVSAF